MLDTTGEAFSVVPARRSLAARYRHLASTLAGPNRGHVTTQKVSAGPRVVRAPRGTQLSCKGWQQEAALRMLMNNLDPEVAERPARPRRLRRRRQGGAQLGGASTPSWPRCKRLENDETLLVQSGKPVGVFQTHEWAPRVLIANANLVPRLGELGRVPPPGRAGPHHVRPDDGRLWIYIGTQGILQGTYQTFASAAEKHYGAGSTSPAAWCSPPAWAAWAARSRWPSPWRAAWRCASRSTRCASSAAWRPATSTARPTRSTRPCAGRRGRRRRQASRSRSACWATPPTSTRSSCAAASCPTWSPTRPRPTTR